MRSRLLDGMNSLMRDSVLPALNDPRSRSDAEHVLRTLALLSAQEHWSTEDLARYADHAGLRVPAEASIPPGEALAALRAEAAASPTAAAVAAEHELQRLLAARRDADRRMIAQVDDGDLLEADAVRRLEAYLRTRTRWSDVSVRRAVRIPGGRCKQTFRIDLDGSGDLPSSCVLRVDRQATLLPTRAVDEFTLLTRLGEQRNLPVPAMILGEEDLEPLGGTFVLMEYVEGEKGGEFFPEVEGLPDRAHDVALHLAAVLGQLHAVPSQAFRLRSEAMEADALRSEIGAIYAAGHKAGLAAVEFEAAHRWLLENTGHAEATPRLRHGDIGLHNMLVRNGRIVALLDWELACLGPAAADLASARHLVEAIMPWSEFTAAYLAAGGDPRAVEPDHLNFWTAFLRFKVAATSQTCGMMFSTGMTDDFTLANAGFDSAVRGRQLLSEMMAHILCVGEVHA